MVNIFALALIGFGCLASARISAVYTCNDLLKYSDVVVKGEVLSVKDKGLLKAATATSPLIEQQAYRLGAIEQEAIVRVDRVINGEVSEKNIAVVIYRVQSNAVTEMVSLKPHEYVVLFLKKAGKGYTLIDLDHGKLIAAKVPGRKPNARGRAGLSDEFSSLLDNPDPNFVREGIKCLGELGEANNYLPKLKQLKDSKAPEVKWKSLVWLSRSGDDLAAKEMIAAFPSIGVSADTIRDFSDALASLTPKRRQNLSPSILPLLQNSNISVRRAAIHYFRNTKDKQFIPQALSLLDDSDTYIQYDALMMICESVRPNREGCPSTILFKENPSKYISEWKSWWEAQKSNQK